MRVLALSLVSSLALAQKPTPPKLETLAADVAALKVDVAEARKGAADAEAAQKALADVESRLIALGREVDRLAGLRAADADVRRELDRLGAESASLRARVAQLADRAAREEADEFVSGDSLALRTPDGNFAMKLGARLHFRHDYQARERRDDVSSFLVRRGKLAVEGHAWRPRLGYKVQLDFAKRDDPLEDFYVDYRRFEAATFRFGQFKVPFDRQRILSSARMQFPDRSVASEAFDLDRDVGIQVLGGWRDGLVQWNLAVLNGGGENVANDNIDYLYVARLLVSPWGPAPMEEGDIRRGPPRVTFGGGFAYDLAPTDIAARTGVDADAAGTLEDRDGDGDVDNVAVVLVGAELTAHWRGASLQGEYFWRREDPGAEAIGPDRTFRGFYAQAGYWVLPRRVELAARASWAEPHHYGATLADRQSNLPETTSEYSGVVTYARFGQDLKLQLEYAFTRELDIGATADVAETFDRDAHRVRTQLQLNF